MQQDASMGFIRKELYVAKEVRSVSEEEALKMMPAPDTSLSAPGGVGDALCLSPRISRQVFLISYLAII